MNGYIATFKGKQLEVYADTAYAAQQKAVIAFKIKPTSKQRFLVVVHLCEKNVMDGKGEPVFITLDS